MFLKKNILIFTLAIYLSYPAAKFKISLPSQLGGWVGGLVGGWVLKGKIKVTRTELDNNAAKAVLDHYIIYNKPN